ncbi:hypothetical protein [Hymenobacter sp. UV11]|uniref:hypothetical protein n=1 Tax=Hymenobacter sp. UV11 TaxID=1849735 RepID=UPI001414FEBB|nr:hypothetical protein [Hymenobacter sp. UV11]
MEKTLTLRKHTSVGLNLDTHADLMALVRQLSAAQNRTLSTNDVLRLLLTSYHGR